MLRSLNNYSAPRWKDPTDLAFIRRFLDSETANSYDPKIVYPKEKVRVNRSMYDDSVLYGPTLAVVPEQQHSPRGDGDRCPKFK